MNVPAAPWALTTRVYHHSRQPIFGIQGVNSRSLQPRRLKLTQKDPHILLMGKDWDRPSMQLTSTDQMYCLRRAFGSLWDAARLIIAVPCPSHLDVGLHTCLRISVCLKYIHRSLCLVRSWRSEKRRNAWLELERQELRAQDTLPLETVPGKSSNW